MRTQIHNALANAARFRAEQGDLLRAEQLLQKSVEIADNGTEHQPKFFARVHLAQFLADQGRHAEAESIYKDAISVVPMAQFDVRHALAIRELGELIEKQGRQEEGHCLQVLAASVFEALADDVCQRVLQQAQHRAS